MGAPMKPRIPLTDRAFDYRDSSHTDVRATWDRLCPGWRERKATPKPLQAFRFEMTGVGGGGGGNESRSIIVDLTKRGRK